MTAFEMSVITALLSGAVLCRFIVTSTFFTTQKPLLAAATAYPSSYHLYEIHREQMQSKEKTALRPVVFFAKLCMFCVAALNFLSNVKRYEAKKLSR